MRFIFVLVLTCLCSTTALAAGVTVDFEQTITKLEANGFSEAVWETQGFRFQTSDGNLIDNFAGPDGSISMSYCPGCTATMKSDSGASFGLVSLAMQNIAPAPGDGPLTITGSLVGGGQIQTVLNVTGDWNNYVFDAGWSDLTQVLLGGTSASGFNGIVVDNIATTPGSVVPIPAAVWLFGSALAGLGWMRRRRIA